MFIGIDYPERTVWRIMYEENRKPPETEWTLENSLYIPYHPRVRKLTTKIKKEYGSLQCTKRLKHLGISFSRKVEEMRKNTRTTLCTRSYAGRAPRNMGVNLLELSRKGIKNMQICAKRNTQRSYSNPQKRMTE